MKLQSGRQGELAAERWFSNNGWHMVRTQPPVTILGMITPAISAVLRRLVPRLACFGHMVIARMGKGGVPDYTGYIAHHTYKLGDNMAVIPFIETEYRAVEVKEAAGDSMPCSRLDKSQRAFMAALPSGCAWVGIFWTGMSGTQKFSIHPFQNKGSYKRPS